MVQNDDIMSVSKFDKLLINLFRNGEIPKYTNHQNKNTFLYPIIISIALIKTKKIQIKSVIANTKLKRIKIKRKGDDKRREECLS